MWDGIVGAHGARPALVSRHQGIRLTYAAFVAEVDRCARGLLALGVARGDRVGMWAPNRAEWAIVQYAKRGGMTYCRRVRRSRTDGRRAIDP